MARRHAWERRCGRVRSGRSVRCFQVRAIGLVAYPRRGSHAIARMGSGVMIVLPVFEVWCGPGFLPHRGCHRWDVEAYSVHWGDGVVLNDAAAHMDDCRTCKGDTPHCGRAMGNFPVAVLAGVRQEWLRERRARELA